MRKVLYALLVISIISINGCSSGSRGEADITEPDIILKPGTYTAKWEIPDKDTHDLGPYCGILKTTREAVVK